MGTFRGQDGFLVFGGYLEVTAGSVRLSGALAAGATTLALTGTGLVGVLAVGDQFTIAGEAGSPVHTVVPSASGARFYVPTAGTITGVAFTPAIAAGGATNNAVVTLTSAQVTEATGYELETAEQTLDATRLGDMHGRVRGGLKSWRASATAHWDVVGDRGQREAAGTLLDLSAFNAVGTLATFLFGIQRSPTAPRFYYAAGEITRWRTSVPRDGLMAAAFEIMGDGQVDALWTP